MQLVFLFRSMFKLCVPILLLQLMMSAPAAALTAVQPPGPPKPTPAPAPGSTTTTTTTTVPTIPKAPTLSAKAVVLMDATNGRVLYALNAYTRRSPASLTKMVTALVAVQQPDLSVTTKVSATAAGRPASKLGLNTGDRISLDTLLHALLLGSCNDAATAIAEQISGSEKAFAVKMNKLAQQLGANDSNFVNPHGLDASGHYSTAYDLALIAKAFLNQPKLAALAKLERSYLTWQGGSKDLANINSFLWRYAGAIGLKTGYTQEAGYSLAAAAQRKEKKLIAILLGCSSSEKRWQDAQLIMDYGMDNYAALSAAAALRPKTYTVQPGDTLTAIAGRLGTTVSALIAANPELRANPNYLLVGQKLNVP